MIVRLFTLQKKEHLLATETQVFTEKKKRFSVKLLRFLCLCGKFMLVSVNRRISIFLFISLSLFSYSEGMAQHKKIDWSLLAKVEWEEKYYKEYDETVYYPNYSKVVLALDSTLIEIEGYVIPVDVESGYYVLSANPFASCFFCGNAGPESVMELQFPKSMKSVFKTDEIVTFKGRLKLNWDDLEHCNYILKNATPK